MKSNFPLFSLHEYSKESQERNPSLKLFPDKSIPDDTITQIINYLNPGDVANLNLMDRKFNTYFKTNSSLGLRQNVDIYYSDPLNKNDMEKIIRNSGIDLKTVKGPIYFACTSFTESWRSFYEQNYNKMFYILQGEPFNDASKEKNVFYIKCLYQKIIESRKKSQEEIDYYNSLFKVKYPINVSLLDVYGYGLTQQNELMRYMESGSFDPLIQLPTVKGRFKQRRAVLRLK